MNEWLQLAILAVGILGGFGVYLLLPCDRCRGKSLGTVCSLAALGALWVLWWLTCRETPLPQRLAFYLLATFTVVGAVMVVTQRSPVASALWFTSVIAGTAGLMMILGAQFLAAATVIVYAGAIIVMSLFVIMLAQQRGAERHDRFARQPSLSTATSVVLLSLILSAIAVTYHSSLGVQRRVPSQVPGIRAAEIWDLRPESQQVAALGRALYTRHWLSVELAGTLLLAGMVGAIVIAAVRRPVPGAAAAGGASAAGFGSAGIDSGDSLESGGTGLAAALPPNGK